MITRTHNSFHLGDNLVHLHFLRKVALANPDRQFVHAAQWQYLGQLQDVVSDIPNLSLTDYNYLTPSDSIDAWRGANGFWYQSEIRNDFVRFHIEQWFPYLCDRMNVDNPIRESKDMLFDYPALWIVANRKVSLFSLPFDVLLINSAPGSGQWREFDNPQLDRIAIALSDRKQVVTTAPIQGRFFGGRSTADDNLSVTDIGNLSMYCHTILMVSTGPSWPTFNVWNQDSVKLRIILLDSERVNLAPNTVHCRTINEAEGVLKDAKLL